ncbi:hypothetical protein BDZ89DRAFT_1065221 [Hymenopellis radicata]|nr:hypothetical protein BDZ89DRAFT_1065214 [Hymenopellis radicata]KAF9029741.1 hypothetical protein BDZ89DRAFT_1065221 [Hymenopellis radicata]
MSSVFVRCRLLTLRWGAVVFVLSAVFFLLSLLFQVRAPSMTRSLEDALWADSWGGACPFLSASVLTILLAAGSTPSPAIASTAAHRPRPTRLHAAAGHSRPIFNACAALYGHDQRSYRAFRDRADVSDDLAANIASANIVSTSA